MVFRSLFCTVVATVITASGIVTVAAPMYGWFIKVATAITASGIVTPRKKTRMEIENSWLQQ